MSDEMDGLFALAAPYARPVVTAPSYDELSSWQIAQLREALDRLGLESMVERQAAVVSAVGRDVQSLRALRPEEFGRTLDGLARQRAAAPAEGSAWDNRDEDTWIDRL